jgi:hypothetical protein
LLSTLLRAVGPGSEETTMYSMYPDWGPSHHRTDDTDQNQAVQLGLDLRDNGGERPDDN